jgi:hypothetical protein
MPPQIVEKRDAGFTWADYRSWPEEERWEIIEGVAYAMSPAPSIKHQRRVRRALAAARAARTAG